MGEERRKATPRTVEELMALPTPRTIPEMWPLAKLRAKTSGKSLSEEILDQINFWLQQAVKEARGSPDLSVGVRALVSARRSFEVLSENGYAEFKPALRLMQEGCESVRHLCCREIVRRLLVDTIDEAKAGECLQVLSGVIDEGQWPDWRQTFDEVESEVCAKLATQPAAAT